ncbi:unnamed protein product [Chilo suppressalis]|uniref:Centromere protein S n=1 Tax=Chilo suppressalis TaxID=168631 RepID=A0ABN8AVI7_CHISP|nr:unnamed protein product [Chilo suppressalis]
MSFENLSRNQKIRATLHRDVRVLCSETCHFLGLEITKPAMEIISELVYRNICLYGSDLESFAKHAKRSTINAEDVKLLVRRNPSLKAHLNTLVPTPSSAVKEKRRKTVVPFTKQSEVTAKPREELENENNTIAVMQSRKPEEFDDAMAVDNTIDLTFE